VPNHNVCAGHDAASCIDDDARNVDDVPPRPNATPADGRNAKATRTANKPLMPTLKEHSVVQMRKLATGRTGVVVKQQVFLPDANRRVNVPSPQALTVEYFAVGRPHAFRFQTGRVFEELH
jgi:hypothetical protein